MIIQVNSFFKRKRCPVFKTVVITNLSPPQAVEDVNVTFEDQQKINKFARNTNRMTELKDEIEAKKVIPMTLVLTEISTFLCPTLMLMIISTFFPSQKSLQNLEDASDDLMLLEDDDLLIPYHIGDVFISHTQEEAQEMLEAAKVSKYPIEQSARKCHEQQQLFLSLISIM